MKLLQVLVIIITTVSFVKINSGYFSKRELNYALEVCEDNKGLLKVDSSGITCRDGSIFYWYY